MNAKRGEGSSSVGTESDPAKNGPRLPEKGSGAAARAANTVTVVLSGR